MIPWPRRFCTREQICSTKRTMRNVRAACWPRAFTKRWYSVTNVDRRLTTPLLVVSSDCSRSPWSCLRKATSKTKQSLLSRKRTQKTCSRQLILAMESLRSSCGWWNISMFLHSTLTRMFCNRSRGPAEHAVKWANNSSDRWGKQSCQPVSWKTLATRHFHQKQNQSKKRKRRSFRPQA